MIDLGLQNRVEKAAAALLVLAVGVYMVGSFTVPPYDFLYSVNTNTELSRQGNRDLLLLLFCYAAVLFLVVLSLLKNPVSWLFLTLSPAVLWGVGNVTFDHLNAWLDTALRSGLVVA